jgi:hypothetical protein
MKTENLRQFLRRKKQEGKKGKEAAGKLVQKAVEVGQRINDWMIEYVRFNEGRLEAIAGTGQAEILKREGDKMLRKFNRRVRALERVRVIQARAFKKAYGIDPPTIEGLP